MILKIVKYPEPVLSQPGEPVTEFNAELRKFVDDLFETTYASQGIGLAAPQVGVSKRITVIDLSMGKVPKDKLVLINPEIEVMGAEIEGGWEGCLSVPGLRGFVERPFHIRYSGHDLDGRAVSRTAKGFHARVVQHECDHLDGRLYPSRMSDLGKLIFESEARHWAG